MSKRHFDSNAAHLQAAADHAVDGIATASADADHLDASITTCME
jgi:hypothetical protein